MRRYRGRRLFMTIGVGLLVLLLVALAALWIARRPIATGFLEREFDGGASMASYGSTASACAHRRSAIWFIGDPRRPDLTARFAQIQTASSGTAVEVYRLVARGVRLAAGGGGRVSWADRQAAAAADRQAVRAARFVLDVADSSISLVTPFGPLGIARGAGT